MITVDEIHEMLDSDSDVNERVRRFINIAKTFDVISFSNYREIRCKMQGWKPVSLEEYRASLQGNRVAVKAIQDRNKRRIHNLRIQDKIERENPFNGLA